MSKKDELTVTVDIQGLDEFLDAFGQMDTAVDELRNSIQRLGWVCRIFRKTFHITNHYHITYSGDPDEKS